MILAEIGLGEILWSLLTIFFMVVYFMMLVGALVDLFRDHELSGVAKAVWLILFLVFPLVTLIAYVILRGEGMARRSAARARAAGFQFDDHVRSGAGAPADQIAKAKTLFDEGTINADEFDALKRKALT